MTSVASRAANHDRHRHGCSGQSFVRCPACSRLPSTKLPAYNQLPCWWLMTSHLPANALLQRRRQQKRVLCRMLPPPLPPLLLLRPPPPPPPLLLLLLHMTAAAVLWTQD